MNDITHSRRLRLLQHYLVAAIRWRESARHCRYPESRTTARRCMRMDALAWRRLWEAL